MRILFDCRESRFKSVFGPIRENEACRFAVHIPCSCQTQSAWLVLYQENGEEFHRFPLSKRTVSGDYDVFSASIALSTRGLYFYAFFIQTAGSDFFLYRYGTGDTNIEDGEKWQLSCLPADYHTPTFLAGSVIYQIFPDRFFKAGNPDLSEKLTPFSVHKDLSDTPVWQPDENGVVQNTDFFGGNLKGIRKKLPYLAKLGVNILYLNPVFKARSNHRYDTADYHKIDEMLGTEKDFIALCRAAHRRKMKVILDGVFSHTGSDSIYFDAEKRFMTGAVSAENSPFRDWFEFQEYPDKYTAWWGISTLPCTNELSPSYLDYMIRDEDSVVAHWLKAGADGFRLDVADELPDEFIALLRRRVKEINKDAFLIGEVWEDASNKVSYGARRKYFTDGELDSVMNYPFRTAIFSFLLGEDDGDAFCRTVESIAEHYPAEVLCLLMNLISTHDTARALTALSGIELTDKKEQAAFSLTGKDREIALIRMRQALFLQFILPGIPSIYYGDEVEMEGYGDPFCRRYFPWGKTSDLQGLIRRLSAIKKEKAIRLGSIRAEKLAPGVIRLTRRAPDQTLTAFVNASAEPFSLPLTGSVLLAERFAHESGALFPGGFVLIKA